MVQAHHTHTHTIVRVREEDADSMRQAADRQRALDVERERAKHREEREFLERRLLLFERRFAAQEDYAESLLLNARQGILREGRAQAAVVGMCAILAKQQSRMLLQATFLSLQHADSARSAPRRLSTSRPAEVWARWFFRRRLP